MYHRTDREAFIIALAKAQESRGAQGLSVAMPDNGCDYYICHDGKSGFAINFGEKSGTAVSLCSVFSHASVRGRLPEMIEAAERKAHWFGFENLTIDCFEPLASVYARHGFVEFDRVRFDWEFAPEGWTPDMGEPDVVFMYRRLAVPAVTAA